MNVRDPSAIGPDISSLPSSAIVWDNHACMPLRTDADYLPQLARYRKAGATVVSLNVGFGEQSWMQDLRVLSFMRNWIAQQPADYRLIARAEDVQQCQAEGTLGIVFDIEGMSCVAQDLSLVQTFYELGVRWMLIAYNRNNPAGGGCLDRDGGLTTKGRAIIDEMQRVGMVLCLSHTGTRTAADAIEYSRNPVIFSHSNPHGDVPHPRNISDDLIRACARKGGVIGLSGIGPFLGADTNLVEHLLRQLRYVIDLVGAEHVGLGLDYVFDHSELSEYVRMDPTLFPSDIDATGYLRMLAPEALGAIAEGLAKNNFTDAQILGVLGRNWLRIATQVWR